MRPERRKAIITSSIVHIIALLLIVLGVPDLIFTRTPPPAPLIVTVDILPISEITNVKPQETPPAEKQAPEKTPEAKKATPHVTNATPPPPPPLPQPTPAPPKPEKKKDVVKKPEEKKPEKSKEDDLLAVLKSVRKQAAAEESKDKSKDKEKAAPSRAHSDVPYDPNLKLSVTLTESIKQQLYKCWNVDPGAKDAYKLVVVIDLWLNRDGSLIDAQFTNATKAKMGDPAYRAAADAGMRAVHVCSPLQNLPADKYEGWSYMEFNFDPAQMLY